MMHCPDRAPDSIERELAAVYRLYAALAERMDPATGLGGKLLFAGELDAAGYRLVRAANIAGAATLAAAADTTLQRLAIREGVIDFLVTSLDEALRILKNEIRKRQTVAVGVALAPETVLRQMDERGVLPDLLPPASSPAPDALEFARFLAAGAQCVEAQSMPQDRTFFFVSDPSGFPLGLDKVARLLAEELAPEDHLNQRWLRLSPRYLRPDARRIRSFECSQETALKLQDRVCEALRQAVQRKTD
jgi:urocanate hydratase